MTSAVRHEYEKGRAAGGVRISLQEYETVLQAFAACAMSFDSQDTAEERFLREWVCELGS